MAFAKYVFAVIIWFIITAGQTDNAGYMISMAVLLGGLIAYSEKS